MVGVVTSQGEDLLVVGSDKPGVVSVWDVEAGLDRLVPQLRSAAKVG
jgi:hypothetical protein